MSLSCLSPLASRFLPAAIGNPIALSVTFLLNNIGVVISPSYYALGSCLARLRGPVTCWLKFVVLLERVLVSSLKQRLLPAYISRDQGKKK